MSNYVSRTFQNLTVASDVSVAGHSMATVYSDLATVKGAYLTQTSADARYDASGAAATAETAAKSYADGLASGYDASGAAATAETAAKSYADGLAANYDASGAAATAQTAAQSYADGLASNYASASSVSGLVAGNSVAAVSGQTLIADLDLSALTNTSSGNVYILDGGAADRWVVLPSPIAGMKLTFINAGATNKLRLTFDSSTSQIDIAPSNAISSVTWNAGNYYLTC